VAEVPLPASFRNVHLVFDRAGRQLASIDETGFTWIGSVASATMHHLHLARPLPSAPDLRGVTLLLRGTFSPDGHRFATGISERTALVWDTESGEQVELPLSHGGPVWMARFSPDGRRVLTASADGTARLWDARTGARIEPPLVHPVGCEARIAVFSPDGSRIATVGSDANVRLWDAASGKLETVLAGHTDWVVDAVFSPDGALLLTYGFDRSARIWRVATGELALPPLEHGDGVVSAAFSPDGARVVTAAGELVRVWDVMTGRLLGPPFVHPGVVYKALFSPDGSSVLTTAKDAVRIWSAGLDARTLEDWRRVVKTSPPPPGTALDLVPAAPASTR
jgi:WD40 repeat protein